MDSFYLTQEDYVKAKANGISYENAYARFYNYGWSVEDTINKPLHRPSLWSQYKELADEHGIKQGTFYDRVAKGIKPEEAATLPNLRIVNVAIKVTPEIVAIAAANGISKGTLKYRVHKYRWPIERAMTEPINAQYRRKDLETVST
jgi:hypothetical protein